MCQEIIRLRYILILNNDEDEDEAEREGEVIEARRIEYEAWVGAFRRKRDRHLNIIV